jgi:hypothetical protein
MKTPVAVPVMLLAALLFAGCDQDVTDPPVGGSGELATPSLGKSQQTDGEKIPFFGSNWLWSFDGCAVYYFYVADPTVIDKGRNLILLAGPDFDALAYEQTVAAKSHWQDRNPYTPKNFHLRGIGPVEFWFFSAAQAEAMVADMQLTRGEMESYSPLKGWASMYLENNLTYPVVTFDLTAQGNLEGGGSFHVNIHERWFGPGPFDTKWNGNIILKQ